MNKFFASLKIVESILSSCQTHSIKRIDNMLGNLFLKPLFSGSLAFFKCAYNLFGTLANGDQIRRVPPFIKHTCLAIHSCQESLIAHWFYRFLKVTRHKLGHLFNATQKLLTFLRQPFHIAFIFCFSTSTIEVKMLFFKFLD